MLQPFRAFFQAEGFMPHGMCYLWRPELLWLHVASDFLTGAAYWAIPPALLFLVVAARRELRAEGDARGGLPYEWMFVAFGLFIVACGTTHFMAVWTVWEPRYWLSGSVKAVTAVASLATAVALPPLVPRALALLRSAHQSESRRLELEEANAELARLNDRLREADRLRAQLFANVSHELRTPLGLILGPVETMLEDERLLPGHRERLEGVQRNARSLLAQVNDLLEAARLEAGALEMRWTRSDVAALLRSVASDFEVLAEERRIRLEVFGPPSLPAEVDEEKVRRIATNLLANAFKFTPDSGRIHVRLGREDAAVAIFVSDSGPGVPEHQRELVFERFRQGEGGATRRRGGTGLGLAIVRETAALHGGSAAVTRDPELGGARFVVRLQATAPPDVPVGEPVPAVGWRELELARVRGPVDERFAPAAHGGTEGRSGRILVVEDNREMARHLAEVLGTRWDVALAYDGEQALARAVANPPDLVITDVMMPRMSGDALVRAIREHPELDGVPVLVLTARADETLPAELLRAGAQDYVVKPVPAEELRARAANLLSSSVARRVLQEELATKEEDVGTLSRIAAERKRRLESALREKEVLLRELAHRVKGSLQTLASLMAIQLRGLEPGPAREALEESRGRVAAMALLHDRLTLTGDASSVDLGAFVDELVRGVVATRRLPGHQVRLEVAVEEVLMPLDRAVPCGLLVHELVSNAMAHAFSAPEGIGTLRVTLRNVDGEVRLTVADDGRGGWDATERPTLGMRLVEALADQLGARTRLERDGGTRWTVEVPLSGAAGTLVEGG